VEFDGAEFAGRALAGGARDFRIDRPHLKRITVVKYENMVADPAGLLPTIYATLGLKTAPTTFEPTTEHNQRYFAKWNALAKDPETAGVIEECIERYEPAGAEVRL